MLKMKLLGVVLATTSKVGDECKTTPDCDSITNVEEECCMIQKETTGGTHPGNEIYLCDYKKNAGTSTQIVGVTYAYECKD